MAECAFCLVRLAPRVSCTLCVAFRVLRLAPFFLRFAYHVPRVARRVSSVGARHPKSLGQVDSGGHRNAPPSEVDLANGVILLPRGKSKRPTATPAGLPGLQRRPRQGEAGPSSPHSPSSLCSQAPAAPAAPAASAACSLASWHVAVKFFLPCRICSVLMTPDHRSSK